ncbi:MAG TPA: acyl carrier protein, partial [Polyangiaceae bacterium]|nr:acyl carrier protein [Polyangiaceae bacterium]
RLDPARLEGGLPFGSLGLDSLMGLEIRNRLEAGLALKLPATLLWTYPSVRALAGQLLDKLAPVEAPPDVGAGAEAEAQRAERDRAQTVAELAKLGEDDLAALLAAELGAAPDSRQP